MINPGYLVTGCWPVLATMKGLSHCRVEGVIDQGGFSRTRDTGYAGKNAYGDINID